MHHIYHTEGIILSSKNFGEAGRHYSIFTRDLGMIYASAQGVRKMSSKLRFVLQDYSYLKIDFVRGKDFWRLTSATKGNKLEDITKNRETFAIMQRVSKLLKRLLAGEDANEALFADLVNGLTILEKSKTPEELRNIEVMLVLRILGNLGYIGESKNLDNLIRSPFEEGLVYEVAKSRPEILNQINKALKETHL
ncbi:MAG: DNA repair protein RecO [Candidatus Pacebacteria bacterium]|nr:DNA repair protein RecO [Candidatus Paceibacterota bacterium]